MAYRTFSATSLAAIFAWFALATPVMGQNASQLLPVYLDQQNGFVYFLVQNNGSKTIYNLFGWVYGSGSPSRKGVYLINNPNQEGMKISLGEHVPGSAAMYRFPVTADNMDFTEYRLAVNTLSLRYPTRAHYKILRFFKSP